MNSAYTTDVAFPSTYSPQQAPIHMSATMSLAGFDHTFNPEFAYCDFGCGDGFTVSLFAACYPKARFYGVDINPTHIRAARAFAEKSGIGNVKFIEADFRTLTEGQIPQIDYAAISGVYSWLDDGARESLVQTVSRHLHPGGACAVQYRCMPGAVRTLVSGGLTTLLAGTLEGASADRVSRAVADLSAVLDTPNLEFNRDNPAVRDHLREQKASDPLYLAHDVLNADHRGLWFHQVAASFESAGLSFAAQLRPQLNACRDLFEPSAARSLAAFQASYADPIAGEEIINLLTNAGSRWDLYVKGVRPVDLSSAPVSMGGQFAYGPAARQHKQARQNFNGRVAVDLSAAIYDTALEAVETGAIEAGALCEALTAQFGPAETRRALKNLFGVGLLSTSVQPIAGEASGDPPHFSGLDRRLIFDLVDEQAPQPFPSRRLGTCILLPRRERIFLAVCAGNSVESAWKLLAGKSTGLYLPSGGQIENLAQFSQMVTAEMPDFSAHRLPERIRMGLFA